jgi:phytoene dehydrogenase-like protein
VQDIVRSKLFSASEKLAFVSLMAKLTKTKPAAVADVPVGEWIEQQTSSPVLRQALLAVVRLATYSNAPELLSTAVFLSQFQLKADILYLDGGWQTLVDGLRQEAEGHGVEIMTGVRVTAVSDKPDQVHIQLANGQRLSATAVILASDPQTAAQLVPQNRALQNWANSTIPVRAAVLDVVLRRLPKPAGNFALGFDEPTYLSNHRLYAQLGPQNGHLIHVAKYLPVSETDPAQDEAELEALLDMVQPGWRAELLDWRFLPNMTVVSRLALANEGGFNGRPGYAVPKSHHLYLAGDWVGPEGWLADASLVSGKRAAELVLAQQTETRDWQLEMQPISNL